MDLIEDVSHILRSPHKDLSCKMSGLGIKKNSIDSIITQNASRHSPHLLVRISTRPGSRSSYHWNLQENSSSMISDKIVIEGRNSGTAVARKPAQSKCTCKSHTDKSIRELTGKMPRPRIRRRLCANFFPNANKGAWLTIGFNFFKLRHSIGFM